MGGDSCRNGPVCTLRADSGGRPSEIEHGGGDCPTPEKHKEIARLRFIRFEKGGVGLLESGPTINGFKVASRDMTQLGIIRNLKNGLQHFTRVIPLENGTPLRPLCAVKGNNRISKYDIVGQLFDMDRSLKEVRIHHEKDFCQPCKMAFRRLFHVDLTSPLFTATLPEAYPGQPLDDRFWFFGSSFRDGRDTQSAEGDTPDIVPQD